jgi:hypothetical protein
MPACRKLKTTGTFRPLQELSSPTSQPLGCQRGPAWPSRCVLWRHCRKSENALRDLLRPARYAAAQPATICRRWIPSSGRRLARPPATNTEGQRRLCAQRQANLGRRRRLQNPGRLGRISTGGCGGGTPRRERQKDSRCQLIFRDAARRPHQRQPLLTRRDALAMLIPVHGELRENVRQGELFS